ncbi:MAG: hypothetical protein ACE5IR_01400 [bacterium]
MSEIATYTFLPWLRQGIANQISGQTGIRATIPVDLTLSGEKVDGGTKTEPLPTKNIEIYGPGDIIGIDRKAIIKVEPRNWITNFEPNYLPYIEFYDEDFPWRYSPLTPSGHRLLPWIMLIVLKEDEFKDGKNIKDRPLPYITSVDAAKLPPSDQLWAWTHVHVNKNLIGTDFESTHSGDIQSKLETVLRNDPDMAYSRIVCPRKLEENAAYHAFLVPVFESGRLAGLGQDSSAAGAYDTLAWTDAVLPDEIPYYHRWYFRTGTVGDFEYLVRLLEPKPVDSRVGLRDMDVQKPGANIRGIVDADDAADEQKLGGILKLGGALRIPDIFYNEDEFEIVQKYRNWATLNHTQPYPHPFQKDLAAFINLTDSYEEKSAQQANSESGISEELTAEHPEKEYDIGQNPDPLITAPLYARWHALTQRLLKTRDGSDVAPNDNWVHELNLDPRWRVAAGFGTKVVQENQEDYMKAAWEQVGAVLEANKKIRQAQLAKEVSWVWHQTHLKPIKDKKPDKWLTLAAPLQKRVMHEGVTVFHQVNQSKIPRAVLSAPMRKSLQPRGKLLKRLTFDANITANNLVSRVNEGAVSAALPREIPTGTNTLQDLSKTLKPDNVPDFLSDLLGKYAWLKWIPLILASIILLLLLLFSPGGIVVTIGIAVIAGLVYAYWRLNRWTKQIADANSVLEENQTPESVDELRKSPDFRISTPDEDFTPTTGEEDSVEAKRFKRALRDVNLMIQESARLGTTPEKPRLNLTAINQVVFATVHPDLTVPKWIWGHVVIPGRISEQLKEEFVEAMAYPEIDLPMYKPLAETSAELFLPNINFIAQNSISLLETNQNFIESYLVGLNHEFARELLWREYPTDQRGSYFRQFWEARGFHDTEELSPVELKEKLRDIPPLHLWSKFSNLGDHDNRETEGENEEEVVLVIRGELLKKYPNAVIYAHRAVWKDEKGQPIVDGDSGAIDVTKERDLRPLTPEEEANPPRHIIKSPLYEAKVEPDIYFFGFDLTVCEAKGGTGKEDEPVDARCAEEGVTWDDPGWFFCIKERPGEPRFGLDIGNGENIDAQGRIEVWNDLSWNDLSPAVENGGFIQITAATQSITADQPLEPEDSEKQEQQDEDADIAWHANMSSAELAYILYQVPVLVAVHASEMLPRD